MFRFFSAGGGVARSSLQARGRWLCVGALVWAGVASGQNLGKRVSAEELRGVIAQMQALVAACAQDAGACVAEKVSRDGAVGEPGKAGGFAVHWGWLGAAVDKAHKTAKAEERAAQMKEPAARLAEMAQQAGAPAGQVAGFGEARAKANAILAGEEFQEARGPTWWQTLVAKIFRFLGRIFDGVDRLSQTVPWAGVALEWLLFVAAAAGLLLFVFRSFARQRLAVALGEGAAAKTAWDRESEDWARLAEASAAAGDWREAVHGLYWASIVHLEGRRLWRHNPSRTPREYVRLLKPGTEPQRALGGLTQIFERVWYGLREATGEEYGRARGLYEDLAKGSASAPVEAEAGGQAA